MCGKLLVIHNKQMPLFFKAFYIKLSQFLIIFVGII